MQREEVAAWLQLLQASGVGGDTARRLLAAFGLPQQVFEFTFFYVYKRAPDIL